MGHGIRVVGATDSETQYETGAESGSGTDTESTGAAGEVERTGGTRRRRPAAERRRRAGFTAVCAVAVLGLIGTLAFGLAWSGQQGAQQQQAQVRAAASSFLVALTNFNAKTVDADFSAVTAMATGPFAGQADKFFNSAIRKELETALASSRGQIRNLYVQTVQGTKASVYAVVDQLYANNKITAPQSDVLRIVVDLARTATRWKISNVTVLEGPSSASGSTSPSTPSTTPQAPAG